MSIGKFHNTTLPLPSWAEIMPEVWRKKHGKAKILSLLELEQHLCQMDAWEKNTNSVRAESDKRTNILCESSLSCFKTNKHLNATSCGASVFSSI